MYERKIKFAQTISPHKSQDESSQGMRANSKEHEIYCSNNEEYPKKHG